MSYAARPMRSALDNRPTGGDPIRPTVALIVPIFNEAGHIRQLVADLRDQDYAAIAEIWFVDGMSTDGTLTFLAGIEAEDRRVRVLENPRRLPAAALNIAIAQTQCEVVIRLDAHARYERDIVSVSVATLLETGAGGVGTIARPAPGGTLVAQAITAAHKNPLGLAVASFRREGRRGWADTVWNGCYWKHVIDELGGFREDLARAEDNDFHARLRAAGYGLYLTPEIRTLYQPRTTIAGLARQYRGNGRGVAHALFENPAAVRAFHFAPLLLILGLGAPLFAGIASPLALSVAGMVSAAYALVLLVAMMITARLDPGPHVFLLPPVLIALHFSYGWGALEGLISRLLPRRPSGHGHTKRFLSEGQRGKSLTPHGSLVLPIGLALAFTCAASIERARASSLQVWLAPSLVRIGHNAPPGPHRSLEIYGARGEWESFQVGFRTREDGGPIHSGLHIGALEGPSGAHISASNITIYRQHFVHVGRPSPYARRGNRSLGAGWYADALIPISDADNSSLAGTNEIIAAAPGPNRSFWVDIRIPEDAVPGRYTAAVTVRSGSSEATAHIALNVWDFALPLVPTLNSAFLVWKSSPEAAVELLRHRLMPRSVSARDQPELIERWGLKSTNMGFWSEADHKSCTMGEPPPLDVVRAAAARAHPNLRRYNYTADEIDLCPQQFDTIKAWGRVLHAAGIDNLITMTPRSELYDDGSGTGRSAVDIWVLLPSMYEEARAEVQHVLAKGDEIWSYNALVQDDYSPKWQIDFAPVNFRIQPGFLSQSLGISGLLYWRVDGWTEEPWRDVYTYRNQYPGEGMLLYPSTTPGSAGVSPSLRLKWIRDGVEDFEYIAILKRHGCEKTALEMARALAPSWRDWPRDPDSLEQKRRKIGTLIERAVRSPAPHCK